MNQKSLSKNKPSIDVGGDWGKKIKNDSELNKISKTIYSIKPWDEYVEQTLNDHSAKKAIVKLYNILQKQKQKSFQEGIDKTIGEVKEVIEVEEDASDCPFKELDKMEKSFWASSRNTLRSEILQELLSITNK